MSSRRPVAGTALFALSAGLFAVAPLSVASAASPNLVISQVYGGGGNSGAPFTHDFVEIYNRGTTPASTAGMSIQYASAAGSGNFGASTTGVTPLPDLTVPAGGYVLVQEAGTAPGNLPTPDVVDDSPIALSGTAGKVALVTGTASLGCNSAANCTPAAVARIVDLVGFGNANYFEGAAAAPTASNTTAVLRAQGGAVDTDQNQADFSAGAPNPRNSGGVTPPEEPEEPPVELYDIAEVQGAGATSPLRGTQVAVEGVVTADFQASGQFGGFFVQSVQPDADAATSDGIRVFQNATAVAVGDLVRVTGTVEEFASSGNVFTGSETQFGATSVVTVLGQAPVPAPTVLTLPFGVAAGPVYGQERYEGVLVTIPAGLLAADLYELGRFGEVGLVSGALPRIPTSAAEDAANNANRITLDDARSGQNLPTLPYTVAGDGQTLPRAGDRLDVPVTGALAYANGEYKVEPAGVAAASFTRLNPRTPGPDAVGGNVQVASFNVLNYFVDLAPTSTSYPRGANTAAELERQQAKLVSAITGLDADVVGLIEMANDDGDALNTLVAALNAAQPDPADRYTAVQAPVLSPPNPIGGTYGTDAIRTAIIYRASVVTPAGPPPSDPAVLNPSDPAFPAEPLFDRPPAVQAFVPTGGGEQFTVLVNHLKSKGSTNAQCGTPDPFGGNCDDLRERQAAGIADLVDTLGATNALLLGDFNSYEEEDPIDVMEASGFTSAEAARMATADRYSYSFDGEFGTLDYVFTSPGLTDNVTGVDIWHINSAEAPAYDYNDFNQPSLYASDPFASSDHDPALVGLNLDKAPVADAGGPYRVRSPLPVILNASGSADPEGARLSYAWDLDGDGQFDDARGPLALFWKLRPGTYPVAVQVSDGTYTSVDTSTVTVRPLFG